jgi:hypothetical protein
MVQNKLFFALEEDAESRENRGLLKAAIPISLFSTMASTELWKGFS